MKTSKSILPVLIIAGLIFTGCAKKLEVSKEPIAVPQTQIVESDKEKLETQSKEDQSKKEAVEKVRLEAKAKQELILTLKLNLKQWLNQSLMQKLKRKR